jgi:hypothetical protein
MKPEYCTGSLQVGHSQTEYDLVGLSPCGEYVAHWIGRSCRDVKDIKDNTLPGAVHVCQCVTGTCPCGSFISHKLSDPCPIM